LGVEAYHAMGYLPEAMRNYLARLGWSHGDDEIFSTEQMIAWFGLEAVGKASARFDFVKLESLNGYYLRHMPDAELVDALIAYLPFDEDGAGILAQIDEAMRQKLTKAMGSLKERAKTLKELRKRAEFLFLKRKITPDAKAQDILDSAGRSANTQSLAVLAGVDNWSAVQLERALKSYAESQALKLGKLAQPLRAALTGTTTSPGIFEVLEVLGREESLARIRDQSA